MNAPTIGQDVITATGAGASPLLVIAILVMLVIVLAIICDPRTAQR